MFFSAEINRTGMIILCDTVLRMAKNEQTIDILNTLEYIKTCRSNMVETLEQYKLVHLIVLEYLFGMETNIPCNDEMNVVVANIIQSQINKQMKYLKSIEWQDHAMKLISESHYEDVEFLVKGNNKFHDILSEYLLFNFDIP